ncbi:MAG: hypothetical protein V4472_13050 [Pseudomonadota bacterium]
MLKLLRHLLCLGLLFGLAGNGVAVAAPCILMPQSQPAAMADMPGCDMAQPSSQSHESNKGKAPGCMAMTACTAVLAMKEPAAPAAGQYRAIAASFWPTAAVLAGRDVAPEPEPPTFLG